MCLLVILQRTVNWFAEVLLHTQGVIKTSLWVVTICTDPSRSLLALEDSHCGMQSWLQA